MSKDLNLDEYLFSLVNDHAGGYYAFDLDMFGDLSAVRTSPGKRPAQIRCNVPDQISKSIKGDPGFRPKVLLLVVPRKTDQNVGGNENGST